MSSDLMSGFDSTAFIKVCNVVISELVNCFFLLITLIKYE